MINLTVSNSSPLPLYKQLYDQISGAVICGKLAAGSPLPPIRKVATELKVSVISVKRAWEDLERDGFIVTAVGRGSFAAELSQEEKSKKRNAMITEALKSQLEYCKALGADLEEIQYIVQQIY